MRILEDALSILDDFGEICRIDTTAEQLRGIVVQVLGRVGYEILVSLWHYPGSKSRTVIAWRARTVATGSKNVAVPDIVVPHAGSSRSGSGELGNSSWERVRGRGCVGTAVLVARLQQSRDARVGPQCYVFIKVAGV